MRSDASQKARNEAQKQWNTNPCGAVPKGEDEYQYFADVENDRYRQQYWQKSFFDFIGFRNKKVLEIGVGHGTDLRQFARVGAECHGIDITDKHLELTGRSFELEGLKVKLHSCDATSICYPNEYFDCVYSFGVVHHIPEIEAVLLEIKRIMKPGGKLQIAVYHKWSIHALATLAAAVRNRSLFKYGVSGALAQIESGADGVTIKPYVCLYSKKEVVELLVEAGFTIQKIGIRQINFEGKKCLNFLRPLESLIGWYVCVIAVA